MNTAQKTEALRNANTKLDNLITMDPKHNDFNKTLKDSIIEISKIFGIIEEELSKDTITRENLFDNNETWIFK